jgi:integral membrane protein
LRAALLRFRVLAYVVGVVLLVLVLVAVPLRYLGGHEELSKAISPVHGFLYIVYLGVTVDLARRLRWSLLRTVLVMLSGTVPFLSFVVERRVTREVQVVA